MLIGSSLCQSYITNLITTLSNHLKNDLIILGTTKLSCQKYYSQELDKLGDI